MELIRYSEDLIRNNPAIMQGFIDFYPTLNDKYDIPDISSFFNMKFMYQLPVWLLFFESKEIAITCTKNAAVCFFHSEPIGDYKFLSAKRGIHEIDGTVFEDTQPTDVISMYNYMIAELIVRIDLNF